MSADAPRWLDGRLLAATECLPHTDAPGVFETLRCERGALAFLAAHLARLERGTRTLALPWPPPWDPAAALNEVAARVESAPAALRLEWTPPHLTVVARAAVSPPRDAGALVSAPGAVEPPRPSGVKTTRRAGYDALRADALRRGAFEALVRAADGTLIEGTISNLFVARSGELATPPLASGALPGIVRAAVLTDLGRAPLRDGRGRSWRAVERPLTVDDLARADEVCLTSSIARVVGLVRVDAPEGGRRDLPGASGPLAAALLARVCLLEDSGRSPGFPGNEPC